MVTGEKKGRRNATAELRLADPEQWLVGAVRFELTTLCSQSRCATRLRYAPTSSILPQASEFHRIQSPKACVR